MDDDGFFMAEIDGVKGLVPSNFLAEATDQYGAGGQVAQGQSILVPCICSGNCKDFTETKSYTSYDHLDVKTLASESDWNPWHVPLLPIFYFQVRLEPLAHFISSDPLPPSPIGTSGVYHFFRSSDS